MSSVVLTPQDLNLFRDSQLTPQWVTSKSPEKAIIYCDSQDYKLENNLLDINISTANYIGSTRSILASGITKLNIESAGVNFTIPNVNIRNNNIQFYSTVSTLTHSVIVPEGHYATSALLIAAVVTTLNTVTGASGLTFSSTPLANFPNKYNLLSAGGNYHLITTANSITKGYQLWNLPIDQNDTNTKIVGTIDLYYTTYIDFCSQTLLKYAKIRTVSTNNNYNIVFRIHLQETIIDKILFLNKASAPEVQYNYNSKEPITNIDLQIRDQFGDLLYVPNMNGNYDGFFWNLSLAIEL